MSASANLTIRIDPEIKRECEGIYGDLGINLSTAVNVFLRKSIRAGGFPFDVRLDEQPNRETMAALTEADRVMKDPNAKRYESVKELFTELESDTE